MNDSFDFHEGDSPLLISIPHDGRTLPPDIAEHMNATGLAIPDTDWHVRRLYEFAIPDGASVIAANHSRYVVDLNRSAADDALYEGQLSTGLCPERTFAGEDIYQDGFTLAAGDRAARIRDYWQPYHDGLSGCLDRMRGIHGFAVLWDAHSIPSAVPLLFDGRLPDLNIGTNGGSSCAPAIEAAVMQAAGESDYSSVLNGRFRGGFITRNYGRPGDGVHAIQLELAQRRYMDEQSLRYDERSAAGLERTIRRLLRAVISAAARKG